MANGDEWTSLGLKASTKQRLQAAKEKVEKESRVTLSDDSFLNLLVEALDTGVFPLRRAKKNGGTA